MSKTISMCLSVSYTSLYHHSLLLNALNTRIHTVIIACAITSILQSFILVVVQLDCKLLSLHLMLMERQNTVHVSCLVHKLVYTCCTLALADTVCVCKFLAGMHVLRLLSCFNCPDNVLISQHSLFLSENQITH